MIKSNSKRAKQAVSVFWVIMTISLVSSLSNYFYLKQLQEINESLEFDEEFFNLFDITQAIIALLFFIVYLFSIIFFLRWFRRAYANLHLLKANPNSKEYMSILYWFIPILFLFKPFKIMDEIWTKTQSELKKRDKDYVINTNTSILVIWWIFFIVSNYIESRNFRKTMSLDDSLESLIISTEYDLLSDLLIIPEAFLVIVIIKFISKREKKLYSLIRNESKIIEA